MDCLNWRVQNEIDNILSVSLDAIDPCMLLFRHFLDLYVFIDKILLKYIFIARDYEFLHVKYGCCSFFQKPIIPTDLYRGIRDSQLIGLSGYSREVLFKHNLFSVHITLVVLYLSSKCTFLLPLIRTT